MPTDFEIEYSQTESTTCPYCHSQISHEETTMRCAECDSVYHQSCWAELGKCGLFGCECTVAHAVNYRPLSGNSDQSRWKSHTDATASIRPVPYTPPHKQSQIPEVLDSEIGLMLKNLIIAPRKVFPTRKSIREARNYYSRRSQLSQFDVSLFGFGAMTVFCLAVGGIVVVAGLGEGLFSPPHHEGIANLVLMIFIMCAFLFAGTSSWLCLLILIEKTPIEKEEKNQLKSKSDIHT